MNDETTPGPFDAGHPLAAPVAAWMAESPRFAAFVAANRDKIRKKARGARDPATLDDLLFELAVARDLHAARHATLAYEPRLPGRTRVPDFALTLPSGAVVVVEVTRIRPPGGDAPGESAPLDARLAGLVCAKLGQLAPQVPNALVVGVPPALLPALDVAAALRALLTRAERRALTPREAHEFKAPADFFRHYRHLSALVARPWPPAPPAPPATLWLNSQAARPLPPRLRPALLPPGA